MSRDERSNPTIKGTHSADREGDPGRSRAHAHEAETQLPVEQMFTDEGD